MNPYTINRFGWPVAWLGVVLALVLLFIGFLENTYSYAGEIQAWPMAMSELVPIIASLLVGGLITAQLPGRLYGWIWILIGLGTGVLHPLGSTVAVKALTASPPQILLGGLAHYLTVVAWMIAVPMIPLALILFPTGSPPSPRWRWAVGAVLAGAGIGILIGWALAGDIGNPPVTNPFVLSGATGVLMETLNDVIFNFTLFAALPLSALSLVLRYRHATGVARAQIRWLTLAAVLVVVFLIFDLSDLHLPWISEDVMTIGDNILLTGLPLSVAVAILRYRLYDVDFIIRKTLIYALLTAALALVYFGSVVVLQRFFETLTGQQSPLTVVLSTLLIAALFSPLRRRVQAAVDRRFYRQKYDAQRVLAAFAQTARDEVALESLAAGLEQVVRDTVKPVRMGLWLK